MSDEVNMIQTLRKFRGGASPSKFGGGASLETFSKEAKLKKITLYIWKIVVVDPFCKLWNECPRQLFFVVANLATFLKAVLFYYFVFSLLFWATFSANYTYFNSRSVCKLCWLPFHTTFMQIVLLENFFKNCLSGYLFHLKLSRQITLLQVVVEDKIVCKNF